MWLGVRVRKSLNKKHTRIGERYFCGKRGKLKPWKEVGRKINLSAQWCITIHDKAIQEFSHKIENEKIKF